MIIVVHKQEGAKVSNIHSSQLEQIWSFLKKNFKFKTKFFKAILNQKELAFSGLLFGAFHVL